MSLSLFKNVSVESSVDLLVLVERVVFLAMPRPPRTRLAGPERNMPSIQHNADITGGVRSTGWRRGQNGMRVTRGSCETAGYVVAAVNDV